MTSTTFVDIGTSAVDRSKSDAMGRIARRRRYIENALAALISVVAPASLA